MCPLHPRCSRISGAKRRTSRRSIVFGVVNLVTTIPCPKKKKDKKGEEKTTLADIDELTSKLEEFSLEEAMSLDGGGASGFKSCRMGRINMKSCNQIQILQIPHEDQYPCYRGPQFSVVGGSVLVSAARS